MTLWHLSCRISGMAKRKFSEEIREAVRASGLSQYRICKESGLDKAALSRFMRGQVGLSVGNLDKLAAVLDLHIVMRGRKGGRERKP